MIYLTVHLKELSKEIELWIKTFLQGVHLNIIIPIKQPIRKNIIRKLYCHVLEGYIMMEMHVKEMDTKLCYAKMFVCANTQDWKKYTKIVVVIPCWCNYEWFFSLYFSEFCIITNYFYNLRKKQKLIAWVTSLTSVWCHFCPFYNAFITPFGVTIFVNVLYFFNLG